jgi:hypothetical protein
VADLRQHHHDGAMVDPTFGPPESVQWRLGDDELIHVVKRGERETVCGRDDWQDWTQLPPGVTAGHEVHIECAKPQVEPA